MCVASAPLLTTLQVSNNWEVQLLKHWSDFTPPFLLDSKFQLLCSSEPPLLQFSFHIANIFSRIKVKRAWAQRRQQYFFISIFFFSRLYGRDLTLMCGCSNTPVHQQCCSVVFLNLCCDFHSGITFVFNTVQPEDFKIMANNYAYFSFVTYMERFLQMI